MDTKLSAFHSRHKIWPLSLLSQLVVCSERHWFSNRMELCHLSLLSTGKLNQQHSARTSVLLETEMLLSKKLLENSSL